MRSREHAADLPRASPPPPSALHALGAPPPTRCDLRGWRDCRRRGCSGPTRRAAHERTGARRRATRASCRWGQCSRTRHARRAQGGRTAEARATRGRYLDIGRLLFEDRRCPRHGCQQHARWPALVEQQLPLVRARVHVVTTRETAAASAASAASAAELRAELCGELGRGSLVPGSLKSKPLEWWADARMWQVHVQLAPERTSRGEHRGAVRCVEAPEGATMAICRAVAACEEEELAFARKSGGRARGEAQG